MALHLRGPGRMPAMTLFAATGLISATWAARLPATADRLHLSAGELGWLLLATEGGALAGLPAGGALVNRYGARASLRLGFLLYAGALVPLAILTSPGWLPVMLLGWAAANSVVDVALNAVGADLEARSGRSLLSSLHAGQSLGLVLGGVLASAAAASNLSLTVHFGAIAVACLAATLILIGDLPAGAKSTGVPMFCLPDRRLLGVGMIAFCGFLLDGGASYWAAIDLRREHHAAPAVAAAGYTSLLLASAITRLTGDRLVRRIGRRHAIAASGIVSTAGAAMVALANSAGLAFAGWTILGSGFALIAPLVIAAAPRIGVGPVPTSIAAVTTVGYLGSFTGPPLIGAATQITTLSTALSLLGLAALAATLLAARLPNRSLPR